MDGSEYNRLGNAYSGLETLKSDGEPPKTRMASPLDATARITTLLYAERRGRAQRRALVKGLVDGNPPYRPADMTRAGRSSACNVNWRVPEYYLNHARSAFYDIFSEAPTYATIRTGFGNANQREVWSQIITAEFDRMLREDKNWDYTMQISQYEMILYGIGPVIFQDETNWQNCAILCRELVVPDFTKSDTTEWEEAVMLKDYLPHQLYDFIRRESIASEEGWNVDVTKEAIMNAHQRTRQGGIYRAWEWHQQMLKNQSYGYSSQSKIISCAHYFFREFPLPGEEQGRITHTILVNPEDSQSWNPNDYMFQHIGRFKNWDEVVHPMYYDNDGGGYHHSVTGLGVKMYSAMEYQNRLLCNLADKVFAPKILFKPTTANANEQLNLVQWGDYGKLPPNFEVMQTPVGSFIDDGMVFNREITGLVSSNLSQYNQSLANAQTGNPITATEARIEASEQARLGKTQLNHYYQQQDRLYAEKFRRATAKNLNGFMPGGRAAMAFQSRCKDQGVPIEALQKIDSVIATRIIGQGSQFMRQQSLEKMLASVALWPSEVGRNNLLSDFIGSLAGQKMVERYNPSIESSPSIDDAKAFATLQVSAAKTGIEPVVTMSQNHFVFAQEFISACSQALAALQQGGNPMEVLGLIDTLGPAMAKHLKYLSTDPSRRQATEIMQKQWEQLAAIHDELEKQVQQAQQQNAEQAQAIQRAQMIQQGTDPNTAIKAAETQAKIGMQQAKTQASLVQKQQKHTQAMALADASTAAEITRKSQAQKAEEQNE